MPALDGTGPQGLGPRTGRGRGVGVGRGMGPCRWFGQQFGRWFGQRGPVGQRGLGGVNTCTCPKCGHKETHKRGTPCTDTKCPKCGATMAGDFCLPDQQE